ncbi:hypothetical protein HYY70_03495 [Candidatus Woesearchaeota archaeon]|nr:hypothetical protein [Candidatus Woesearchaeota archaeon]
MANGRHIGDIVKSSHDTYMPLLPARDIANRLKAASRLFLSYVRDDLKKTTDDVGATMSKLKSASTKPLLSLYDTYESIGLWIASRDVWETLDRNRTRQAGLKFLVRRGYRVDGDEIYSKNNELVGLLISDGCESARIRDDHYHILEGGLRACGFVGVSPHEKIFL